MRSWEYCALTNFLEFSDEDNVTAQFFADRYSNRDFKKIVDLGSGPGTKLAAIIHKTSGIREVVAIDSDKRWINEHRKLDVFLSAKGANLNCIYSNFAEGVVYEEIKTAEIITSLQVIYTPQSIKEHLLVLDNLVPGSILLLTAENQKSCLAKLRNLIDEELNVGCAKSYLAEFRSLLLSRHSDFKVSSGQLEKQYLRLHKSDVVPVWFINFLLGFELSCYDIETSVRNRIFQIVMSYLNDKNWTLEIPDDYIECTRL